ncbi:MAG: F0F1 ATP synthase subunit B [Candidatus Paceibacterota bacterium]|jgi:F-type H+-transporting ATPase subunit b
MEALEINWTIFIGQLINFAILFFLLKFFVYGPFLSMIKKRREKIEEGVAKSLEAEEKLQKLSEIRQRMEEENENEKRKIISAAEEEAKKRLALSAETAEQEKAAILSKAQKSAEALKESEKEKTRKETIDNAFSLAEKLLKENIDANRNKQITEDFLNKI